MTREEIDLLERLTEVLESGLAEQQMPDHLQGVTLPDFAVVAEPARIDLGEQATEIVPIALDSRLGELPDWSFPEVPLTDYETAPAQQLREDAQQLPEELSAGAFPDAPDLPDYPDSSRAWTDRDSLPDGDDRSMVFPDVPDLELNGRFHTDGIAIDAAQDSFGSPPSSGSEENREVIDLLREIHRTLEQMARSNTSIASAGGAGGGNGPGDVGNVHVYDASAEEGYPWASPSVEVSTMVGIGGAGGSSLGSAPVSRSPLLSGAGGKPAPSTGRAAFFEPGLR